MKPLIGISANYIDDYSYFQKIGIGAKWQDFSALANDYTNAVKDAGGLPLIIPVTDDFEYLEDVLSRLDGIVLSGGNDINPHYYQERPSNKLGSVSSKRDEYDIFICNFALKNKKPLLSICRGLQILNIVMGGSLHQDLQSSGYLNHSIVSLERSKPAHYVTLKKGSLLFEAYKSEKIYVNSLHHQGLKVLGEGLKDIGYTEDNLCECVELDKDSFVVGVQWHPEMMAKENQQHLEIFKFLIAAAKK